MSEFQDRCKYFYFQTDGTYEWPNCAEGDLLKIGLREIKQQQARIDELEGIRQRLSDLLNNTIHCAVWPDDLAHALYGDDWESKVREMSND